MGFRFRKSIPIGKAFKINLSRRGVGWSAGIPGTGLSYGHSPGRGPSPGGGSGCSAVLILLAIAGVAWWAGLHYLAVAVVAGLVMFTILSRVGGGSVATHGVGVGSNATARAMIPGPGAFTFDIVGEASYQKALASIAGGKTRDGVEVVVVAELVPEPSNPHDPAAVRVDVDGLTVGYLDRKAARRYRTRIAEDLVPRSCMAKVVGGWDRGGGDTGHFGVKLDLPKLSS